MDKKMKKRMLRVSITWVTDYEKNEDYQDLENGYEKFCEDNGLPTKVEYPIPEEFNLEMIDDYEILEDLSETHGFLIYDISYEEVYVDEE
jgi:hypothetical protein